MYVTALTAFSFAFSARFSTPALGSFCKLISCVKM